MSVPREVVESHEVYLRGDGSNPCPWQFSDATGRLWRDGSDPLWIDTGDDSDDPFTMGPTICFHWCVTWCCTRFGIDCLYRKEGLTDETTNA